ncbi:MAG: hypothetical protein J7K04_02615 [Spirochaetales bacterium]|nr:hypothetical protein [Spirochaetales bacterium]
MDFMKHLTADDLIVEIELINKETKTGIMATVDSDGAAMAAFLRDLKAFIEEPFNILF